MDQPQRYDITHNTSHMGFDEAGSTDVRGSPHGIALATPETQNVASVEQAPG
jgi:hypothetical protein